MATWPVRGQRGPQYWDEQMKAYVDEGDAGVLAAASDAQTDADAAAAAASAAQTDADAAAAAASAAQATANTASALSADHLFLSAQDFMAGTVGGTLPALLQTGNRWNSWQMDPAVVERISAITDIPRGWANVAIDLVWSAPGAGDIVVTVYLTKYAAGDLTTKAAVTVANAVILSAGSVAGALRVSPVAAGPIPVTPGAITGIMVDRIGNNGFDTVTTDVSFIGLLLRRV